MRIYLLASVVILAGHANAGLSGIPSSVSGVSDTEGQAIADTQEATNNVAGFIRDKAERTFVTPVSKPSPATDARAPVSEADQDVAADSTRVVAAGSESMEEQGPQPGVDVVNPPPFGSNAGGSPSQAVLQPIEVELPEGYREVETTSEGYARIDGDKPSTYVVRVPPLLFTSIELPFAPEFETPFPDAVYVKTKGNMLLVAPKSMVPVNLVIYHPEKPSLSASLVLLPDTQSIPGRLWVRFNPDSIPKAVQEKSRNGFVVDGSDQATLLEKDPSAVSEYERASSHTEFVKRVNLDMAQAFVPEGYEFTEISNGPSGALCGDRRLIGKYTQHLAGESYEIDVFQIRNVASDYVVFEEKSCYRSGVVSVQFNPTNALRPGQEAELIVLRSAEKTISNDRVKRPTKVELSND